MKIKPGVSIAGIQPETVLGINIANCVWNSLFPKILKNMMTITSVTDSDHTPGKASLHYVGYAFDLRSHNLTHAQQDTFRDALALALGKEWDVLLEGRGKSWEHFHIEYQPKKNR